MTTPDARMNEIVTQHSGEYPAVFEKVYAAAAAGEVEVPWGEVRERHHWLRQWSAEKELDGTGKKALVVGCGYGYDAEFVASLGYVTTAFDISPTAIELARGKHPSSTVNYQVADLFDPPAEWSRAFDLVVEISTVQALPRSLRPAVTEAIGGFVGQDGRLILIMGLQREPFTEQEFGPWPMTRGEVDAFTGTGLRAVRIEDRTSADDSSMHRWVAEFRR